MKISFIHTGDIHLGRQFHFKGGDPELGERRRMELWKTFDKIIQTAEKNHIHYLIISGDLFDSLETDIKLLKMVSERLSRLTVSKVIICPGNHDYYSPASLYGLVAWPENVTIFKSGKMEDVYFEDTQTHIYGLGWTRDTYKQMPFNAGHLPVQETDNNILVLHGDAFNVQSPFMPIDLSLFDYFDYVALGHIHKGTFLNKRAAYCGCPEPLSFKDGGDCGIVVGQIDRHHLQTQNVLTQKRRFITRIIGVEPGMTMDDLRRICTGVDKEPARMRHFYRLKLEGYHNVDLSLEWLQEELSHLFYYLELDGNALEPDLDIDRLLEENADNIIGRFIQEMRRNGTDPVAKKALCYGVEGLLQHGGNHEN